MIKDISELVKADIISQETANKISAYYRRKAGQSTNRLFVVFGILGSIFVGLGIILIIAHNWDNLLRTTKTFLAFLPPLVGQLLCGFVLLKKQDSVAWRESGTTFLFFSVGATISLVSQIYNMPGNLSSFLLTWMLLCLPLIYVMRSSIASLLYLIGITYYGCETNYWTHSYSESYLHWLLLLTILPHYYSLYKKKPQSNFMIFHNWLIPLSVIINLGTLANPTEELIFVTYFSFFGLIYSIGNLDFFTKQRLRNSGYKVLGFLGTIILLLISSFDSFWEYLNKQDYLLSKLIKTPEFFASAIVSLSAGMLLLLQVKNKSLNGIKPISPVFILFILTFIIGQSSPISAVLLINIFIFAIGLLTIRDGAKINNLGLINCGSLIITAVLLSRFFDIELSFTVRGCLFVSIGFGFFATNYWMLKKRKSND